MERKGPRPVGLGPNEAKAESMSSVEEEQPGGFTLASAPPGPATQAFGADPSLTVGTFSPADDPSRTSTGLGWGVLETAARRERFETLGMIGEGGMGSVLRVMDGVLQRELAMKVIRPEAEADPELALRFVAEAQVTAQLDHPGIVPVHDVGAEESGSGLFFTMKRVSGTTLADALTQLKGGRPKQEVLKRLVGYLIKVCHALEFAHARGVLHCDIKPANIMVGDFDQVYLMDWGVAVVRHVEDSRRNSDAATDPSSSSISARTSSRLGSVGVVGTPAYMAPEQSRGQLAALDERTDVYGLGGVLYELLSGRAPNQRRSSVLPGIDEKPVGPPQAGEIWEQLPPGLVQVAMDALSADRERRQPSVRVFRRQLESFLEGGGWFRSQHYVGGEVIVRQGEQADTAYIIEAGYCEVFVDQGGVQNRVGRLGPGDVFGETAALSTGVRTASVVALGDVMLRVVTRESLDNELSRNPWLGAFVRALALRHRELEQRLNERG